MPQMLQRPADDSSTIEAGQQLTVQNRFLSLSAGQELEVVDVSNETVSESGVPERVALQLPEETPASCAASTMDYHGSDIQRAVEGGDLELQ